jgi:type I restriction enzyme S subunit
MYGANVGQLGYLRAACTVNQAICGLRADPAIADPRYVFYALMLERPSLIAKASGAAQQNLNQDLIRNFKIPLPPLETQRKTAVLLSAYDNLIENNNRRLHLLEEMAQRIYRDWFVDFRYPGSEGVDVVDSEMGPIPDGWFVRPLFQVADVTFGYPFKSPLFDADVGLPVIRIRDIPTGQSVTLTTETAPETYRVTDGDILIGMDGEFHMGRWSAGDAWLNQRVARVRTASNGICPYVLFLSLRRPIADWNQAIVGTTVAHLGKRHLELIRILTPPVSLAARVSAAFDPIFDMEIAIRKSTRLLRAARDFLLPSLISGELDVADLDIAMPEAV